MKTKYSPEQKESILRRLLPPLNESIADVARETGVPDSTLYSWQQRALEACPSSLSEPDVLSSLNMSSHDMALVFADTVRMDEAELAAYAREKGLYVEQIRAIIDLYFHVGGSGSRSDERRQYRQSLDEIKRLKRDIRRKDKALAEAAALLVLSKKASAIWGENEDV